MWELQEEYEYSHPQVGREIGELPSKLDRWACVLWCLSGAVAKVSDDAALQAEVGHKIGPRWYRQAEKLLGYFVGTKTALRTPVAPPPQGRSMAPAPPPQSRSSLRSMHLPLQAGVLAPVPVAVSLSDPVMHVLPDAPLAHPGTHVDGKEPKDQTQKPNQNPNPNPSQNQFRFTHPWGPLWTRDDNDERRRRRQTTTNDYDDDDERLRRQ